MLLWLKLSIVKYLNGYRLYILYSFVGKLDDKFSYVVVFGFKCSVSEEIVVTLLDYEDDINYLSYY